MEPMAPKELEVWKNVAKGMRWYTRFNAQGLESDHRVMGGRTFTLTPFERQINQEKAATPELDHFRNGTFVLVRASEGTNQDEILSPSSKSASELEEMVQRVLAEPEEIDLILKELTSPVSIDRLLEFLVAYDAPQEAIDKTRDAFHKADGGTVAVRRRVVGGTDTVETQPETVDA